jgi:uncharacterized protein involved in type VI secretion and phage assembly
MLFFVSEGDLFAAAADRAGSVTKVRGQVTARKTGDDAISVLKAGDGISVGHIMLSAKDAAAQLAFADGSVIHMLPGTTLQLLQYSYSATENRRTALIKLTEGCLRAIVYKEIGGRFTVETGQAAVSTGIADYFVCATPAGTEITNIGQGFSIENSSNLTIGTVHLRTNQQSTIADKTPPTQPVTVKPEQRRKYLKDAEI